MVAYGEAAADSGRQNQAGQRLWSGAKKRKQLSQEVTYPTIFMISTAGLGLLLAMRPFSRMASKSTLGLKAAVETLGLLSRPTKGSMTAASVVVQTTYAAGQRLNQGRAACSCYIESWQERLRGRQSNTRSVQGCMDRWVEPTMGLRTTKSRCAGVLHGRAALNAPAEGARRCRQAAVRWALQRPALLSLHAGAGTALPSGGS